MTYTDVYLGEVSEGPDPLDWGRDWKIGNTPARLGPFFPPNSGEAFLKLIDKIERGELPGKQVDWGAWAASLSRQQILDFLNEVCATDSTYLDPTFIPHLYPLLDKMRDFNRALPDRRYALVASEL
ncbi:MAG: hypothetical protein ACRDTN_16030 [Mycobacterium sp.]